MRRFILDELINVVIAVGIFALTLCLAQNIAIALAKTLFLSFIAAIFVYDRPFNGAAACATFGAVITIVVLVFVPDGREALPSAFLLSAFLTGLLTIIGVGEDNRFVDADDRNCAKMITINTVGIGVICWGFWLVIGWFGLLIP